MYSSGYLSSSGYPKGYAQDPIDRGPFATLMYYWTFDGSVTTPPDADFYGNALFGGVNFEVAGTGPVTEATGYLNRGISPRAASNTNHFALTGTSATGIINAIQMSFTLTAWVKQSTVGPIVLMRADRNPFSATGFTIDTYYNVTPFIRNFWFDTTGAATSVETGIPTDTWTFVACGYDGGVKKPFVSVNGAAKIYSVGALPNNTRGGQDIVRCGAGTAAAQALGAIDELACYSSALTDATIALIYNGGTVLRP